jgi:hypothetical protein
MPSSRRPHTLHDISYKEYRSLISLEITARKCKAWNDKLKIRADWFPCIGKTYEIIGGEESGNAKNIIPNITRS